MKTVKIENLIDGLRLISDADFTGDNVYRFLAENPVAVDSITKYFFWSEKFYTRNLIYKDARFELMALCWEKGQASRIHNHADQMCWMTVPVGHLRGQNFSAEQIDERKGFCKLKETDAFDLSDCLTAKVELEEPIHQILNLPEFNARAVSLHIYSKPFDRCLSYCRETHRFTEVPLFYASVGGKLCPNIKL
ncbi:MAG: cysteine dioxygenase family protein [Acidobacteria bacterium]|jgi:cysteine dioxygenase|nr:cysteine dioxygenase family protein [Acidobacteriota bacterium]